MNIEDFREFCLAMAGVTEDTPFDENTLVFKVMGKMFALADIQDFESINVKCNPEIALELRERYSSVIPGYHMNKKHWNTLILNGELNDIELKHWIKHSYDLVVDSLPKKIKSEWESLSKNQEG
jgi:predicted DNA-binding protein (MmcQ/YjbR family)